MALRSRKKLSADRYPMSSTIAGIFLHGASWIAEDYPVTRNRVQTRNTVESDNILQVRTNSRQAKFQCETDLW